MKTYTYFLLIATLLLCFQCGTDTQENTGDETGMTPVETTETTPPSVDVQPIDTNISPSEILEENADRYTSLHRLVVDNMDVITEQIDGSTFPGKMKDGLKASFTEVAAYDNVRDIAQTSKYTSAESIEQFMKGLEMYLTKWGIE